MLKKPGGISLFFWQHLLNLVLRVKCVFYMQTTTQKSNILILIK
jgi:hypothetical protein